MKHALQNSIIHDQGGKTLMSPKVTFGFLEDLPFLLPFTIPLFYCPVAQRHNATESNMSLLGAFKKKKKATGSFVTCVCPSICAWAGNNSDPNARISMKCDI
jgi:hypothetical protein